MMGEVIAAMDRPPDAALNRRPWPADTYEVIRADTFHIGGWYDIFTRGTLDQYQAMAAGAARSAAAPSAGRAVDAQLFPEPPRGGPLRAV
jgi:hypothetical protein